MPDKQAVEQDLLSAYNDLQKARERMVELQRQMPHEAVPATYIFRGPNGAEATLEDLFEGRRDLIVIHNMGASCAYCAMWADGFNGVWPHLRDRAAFVVVSPDAPETQARFAASRGWRFPMWSSQGTTFRADMGFQQDDEMLPGVSIFHREADGAITHYAQSPFGPGDDFCVTYSLFDLLPGGTGDWEPRFTYDHTPAKADRSSFHHEELRTLKALSHVTVLVSDYDEALAFYTEKLGFVKRDDMAMGPDTRWLTVSLPDQPDLKIVLQKPVPAMHGEEGAADMLSRIGKATTCVIATDDCQGDYERLSARGVAFVSPPQAQSYGIEALFTDLYGNVYDLVQSVE